MSDYPPLSRPPLSRPSLSARGVIVNVLPYGDYDLILRCLVEGVGKVSLIAKHARKSRNRYGTTLDLFDSGRIEAEGGRGSLWILKSFIPEASFRSLRSSLDRMTAASIVCEAFDALLPEHAPDQEGAYTALSQTLLAIDSSSTIKEILSASFDGVLSLLAEAGFADPAEFLPRSSLSFGRLLRRVAESSDRDLKAARSLPLLLSGLKNSGKKSLSDEEGQLDDILIATNRND